MKSNRILFCVGSAAILASCNITEAEYVSVEPCGEKTTLYARFDESKTALQEDWSVFWEKNDAIAVIGESGTYSFSAENGGSSETTFTGNLSEDTALYSVYPESGFKSRDGNKLTVEIPSLQYGLKDGFDRNAAICVSKVVDDAMIMKHIVALVRFTLTSDDITSVSICNASGVNIAGSVEITVPDSGTPTVSGSTLDHVLLLPENETFEAGTYYVAVAPAALSGGIQFMFTRSSDNRIAAKIGTNPVTFTQASVMNFGIVDTSLSWTEMTRLVLDFAEVDSFGNLVVTDSNFSGANPFSYPETFSSSYKSGTFKDEDAVLVSKEEYGNFKFPVHSTMGFVLNSKTCFRWGRGAGSYITIPNIPGLTLAAVRTVFTKEGTVNGMPCICSENETVNGGGMFNTKMKWGNTVIWHILGADSGETYRIVTGSDSTGEEGEAEMARLEFFYTGTCDKVLGLDCSAAVKSTTSASFTADFSSLSAPLTYTCGFEYKKASESVWTNVDVEKGMSFAYEADDLEEETSYNVRSWVDAGDGKVYSETKTFSTALTKVTFEFSTSGSPFIYPESEMITDVSADATPYIIPLILKGGENYCSVLNYLRSGERSYDGGFGVKWKEGFLLFCASKDSYFTSPAIKGMTLAKVCATFSTSNTTGSATVGIYDDSNKLLSNLQKNVTSVAVPDPSLELLPESALEEGTSYRILLSKGESKKDRQSIIRIDYYYSGTAEATVHYVSKPVFTSSTVSSSIYVNSATIFSNITSGFEYKAGGEGSFTVLSAGSLSPLSGGVTTATASVSLSEGDIVRAWASIDGGTTKVYGPETAI